MENQEKLMQETVDFLASEAKKTEAEIKEAIDRGEKSKYLGLLKKSNEILGRMASVFRSINEQE